MPRPTIILISIILFSMIILGSTLFLGGLTQEYGVTADMQNFTTMNKINQTLDIANEMTSRVQGEESVSTQEENFLSLSYGFIWSAGQALKMVFNVGGIFKAMIIDLSNYIGLPTWFVSGLLAIISIIILASIVTAITRWPV